MSDSKEMRKAIEKLQKNQEEGMMPDQRSTFDQLLTLRELANKNGLYDAADWLKGRLDKWNERMQKGQI